MASVSPRAGHLLFPKMENLMGVISRGVKNAFRNNIRTFSIVLILGVSISMALIMLMAMKTVQVKINSVKSSIGNYVSVSPAGVRGFEGGGELLTDADVTAVSQIPNVAKVVKTINDRLTNGQNTNLQSAIEPGSFGNRQQRQETGTDNNSGNNANRPQNFTMPIMITGTSDLSITANLNVSKFDLTSGQKFDESTSDLVALVGSSLATKNNLTVGSTFHAYGQNIKVVGIFDGGNTFANATAVMPLAVVQNLSGQSGQVSSITVQTSSIDSVTQVQSDIKSKLGDKADVSSQQDQSQNAIAPLENIKTISTYSLIGSLIAGAIIIFLTMVMIVRERRREIGVLKAIGSSNAGIVTQFTVESLVLTLISSIIGAILGVILSNPVLNVLISNASQTAQNTSQGNGPGRGMARLGNVIPGAQNALRDLHAAVGWEILLYGFLAAIVIAIIGSAIPAYIIAKVRPAEVLRSE